MLSYLKVSRSLGMILSIICYKSGVSSITRRIAREFVVPALILLAIVSLGGCASGSALVTGQPRPAIEDHSKVTILTEMPEGSEQIAIVKASSDSGWTQQGSLDHAVDELKRQAAKIGANAIVLADRETVTQTFGLPADGGGTFVSSSEMEIVQGTAIWVD